MKIRYVPLSLILVALLVFVAFSGDSAGTSTLLGFRAAIAQGNTDAVGPVRGNKTSKIYHVGKVPNLGLEPWSKM